MYENFAHVYDYLNDETFYHNWLSLIKKYQSDQDVRVLDLGCGSGKLLAPLAEIGFQVTGVDLSPEMLSLAEEKLQEKGASAVLYQGNMEDFSAGKSCYDIIISSCDSINYLQTLEEVEQMLFNCFEMLSEGGILIFDMHSNYTFLNRFQNWTYGDADDVVSVIWNVFQNTETEFEHQMTFFVQEQNRQTYDRFDEVHNQYFHDENVILDMLQALGFTRVSKISDFKNQWEETGERTFFIAHK